MTAPTPSPTPPLPPPIVYSPDQLFDMKMAHLNMIQGVISRMSTFSASAKTFTVTVLAGLAAISLQADTFSLGMIALVATLVFLATDLYYLKLEIQFRSLYDHVRLRPLSEAHDLAISPKKGADDMKYALMSPTVFFYVILIVGAFLFSLVGLINDNSRRPSKKNTASVERTHANATSAAKRSGEPVVRVVPAADRPGQRIPGSSANPTVGQSAIGNTAQASTPSGDR